MNPPSGPLETAAIVCAMSGSYSLQERTDQSLVTKSALVLEVPNSSAGNVCRTLVKHPDSSLAVDGLEMVSGAQRASRAELPFSSLLEVGETACC